MLYFLGPICDERFGKCYTAYFNDVFQSEYPPLTWLQAHTYCSDSMMTLVSFQSVEEMKYVQQLMSDFDFQSSNNTKITEQHQEYQDKRIYDPISYMYIGRYTV